MDKIFIKQLRVDTIIGVYDFEKQAPQPLFFDLTLSVDLDLAGQSDDLQHTVDYAKVSERVAEVTNAEPVELLETLAQKIFMALFNEFAIAEISLTIAKPHAVLAAQSVGISLVRSRESFVR